MEISRRWPGRRPYRFLLALVALLLVAVAATPACSLSATSDGRVPAPTLIASDATPGDDDGDAGSCHEHAPSPADAPTGQLATAPMPEGAAAVTPAAPSHPTSHATGEPANPLSGRALLIVHGIART